MWRFPRTHTAAFPTVRVIDVAPDDISRTFHHVSLPLPLSPSPAPSPRVSLSRSLCKHRESASAVFFPPLKNCVIEAKWVGKPFGLVSCDFAKKLQKVTKDCLVKMTYRVSVLRDRKSPFSGSVKKKVLKYVFHFPLIYSPHLFHVSQNTRNFLLAGPIYLFTPECFSYQCRVLKASRSLVPFRSALEFRKSLKRIIWRTAIFILSPHRFYIKIYLLA